MCQFEGQRLRVAAERRSPGVRQVCRQARGGRPAEPAGARRAAAAAVPGAGGRMELNSLLLLLEAAEYLERRDREAEHGYASVLPFDGDFARKKTKAAGLVRKAPNNRSSHNELEKHRRAKLRLYLEQLKQLVPLGPDSTRHTTLSLLKRAKMHIKTTHSPQKLEEQDRRALSIKEQLQREHRFLKRRLEQLSVQSVERVRTDSTGSAVSTDDSEQEVDIEGMEFGPGELDSVGSSSDADDHYILQSNGCSDSSYSRPCRRPGRPGLS
ncbi:max dimerization protein 4 isoform X1 [Nannospalax galili]|uniref:max dimerization protein 4 isoform X1 n=1 Tax=Nannospalax galili TaxID=1026970 RepID=UPI00111BCF85|nr:max dimerization protein 4 isoform X1 [Nannospalax galili]